MRHLTQSSLNIVQKWVEQKGLKINPRKTPEADVNWIT